jgi:hypothetical protein
VFGYFVEAHAVHQQKHRFDKAGCQGSWRYGKMLIGVGHALIFQHTWCKINQVLTISKEFTK